MITLWDSVTKRAFVGFVAGDPLPYREKEGPWKGHWRYAFLKGKESINPWKCRANLFLKFWKNTPCCSFIYISSKITLYQNLILCLLTWALQKQFKESCMWLFIFNPRNNILVQIFKGILTQVIIYFKNTNMLIITLVCFNLKSPISFFKQPSLE